MLKLVGNSVGQCGPLDAITSFELANIILTSPQDSVGKGECESTEETDLIVSGISTIDIDSSSEGVKSIITSTTGDATSSPSPICRPSFHSDLIHFLANKFRCVDIPTIENIMHKSKASLSDACLIILGKKLNKSEQLSNWDARPLTHSQRLYATLDAWCLVDMILKIVTYSIVGVEHEEFVPTDRSSASMSETKDDDITSSSKKAVASAWENIYDIVDYFDGKLHGFS